MERGAFVPDSCQAYRRFSYVPDQSIVFAKMALGDLFPKVHISFASRVFRAANLYRGVHARSRLSPFAATLIEPRVSIANKRLTFQLNPLDTTLMKIGEGGAVIVNTESDLYSWPVCPEAREGRSTATKISGQHPYETGAVGSVW